MKQALPKSVPAAIATLTILAMFIAPLCGTLCATPSHCPAGAPAAQLGSDACQHVAMSGDADASGVITAAMNCAQSETIAIAPDETNSPCRPDRTSTVESSIAGTHHEIPTLAASRASVRVTKTESPPTSTPGHSAILRI